MSVLRNVDWRRPIVYVHRWLGILVGWLFVAWFASGIVMMYARMPALPAEELQQRQRPLDLSALQITPFDAARIFGRSVDRLRITMFDERPLYRLASGRTAAAIYADTGESLSELTPDAAVRVIRELAPEHASTIQHDAVLTDADQWTMGVRAQMPMHRVRMGDADDTYFYVAQRTGEVIMRTTARERRWAYPGAVLHWLYFAPFRRQAALWTQSIIWLSVAGCALCMAGLVWGIAVARKAPYAGVLKWHHYAGLVFGVTSLTWVFSGLLSMDPWAWAPGTAPSRAQRDRVAGGPLQLSSASRDAIRRAALALGGNIKEVELHQFRGEQYLGGGSQMVSLRVPGSGAFEQFPPRALEDAAQLAMPDVSITDLTWLREYDGYYYARDGRLPLPVLRVKYADATETWLYLDPRRGAIVRKEERLSRINRWLYRGLHSLDFPFLYYRRPLWDVVVIVLSGGGLVLSVTTLLPGWRRLGRALRLRRTS